MPSLTSYKVLQVLTPDPAGAGGLAIQEDLKQIVDWQPKSVWAESTDPTAGDDEADDFYPGSCWLRTDVTPPRLFVCQSSAAGAAVWRSVALEQVRGTDGSGTTAAGANTVIAPGRSTGNAAPAGTVIQSTVAGASGTSLQSLFPYLTIVGETIQTQNASGTVVMDLGPLSPGNQTQQLRIGSTAGPGRLRLEGNGGNTSQLVFAYNGGSMWTCFTGANQVFIASNGGSGQFLELGPGVNIRASVSPSTGSKLGASATEKWAFWGATPAVQQVLATGAGKSVDDVITFLQTIGLCRQS